MECGGFTGEISRWLIWLNKSTQKLPPNRGTLPAIPICAMYTYYTELKSEYGLALAGSMITCVGVQLAVYACYPSDSTVVGTGHHKLTVRILYAHIASNIYPSIWVVIFWFKKYNYCDGI